MLWSEGENSAISEKYALIRLITTARAAEILGVSSRTVLNWIDHDAIPYVTLPRVGSGRREYRIPLHALLESLSGNYDLAGELQRLDTATQALGMTDELAAELTSDESSEALDRTAAAVRSSS